MRGLILSGRVAACHDVSDGGLLVAIAEMAMAGEVGVTLAVEADHAFWFGEDQARYVLAVHAPVDAPADVPVLALGTTGGNDLTLPGVITISLADARVAHERFFPAWMGT